MTASADNRRAYDAIASAWDAARIAFYGRERHYLDLLLADLAPPARILDLGCGTGRPMAEHVLARGHTVVGVDQSAELLARARERFPSARWVLADVEDFAIAEPYDAVICWDTLFHLPRDRHAPLLARIAGCLPAGGRLMLTVGGSDHAAFTDTMFGETFFYDSHPPEVVLAILRDLGLTPLLHEVMNAPTSGRDKGRDAIVAAKRSEP